jgi:YD repeat-containing protein
VTTYAYANFGREVTVTGPDPDDTGPLAAPVTTYVYDAAGNLLSVTDALDRVTTFAYDELGRKISETGPFVVRPLGGVPNDAPVTQYAYDKAGNVIAVTEPSGQTTQFTYDARNRRVSATLPDPFVVPPSGGSSGGATDLNRLKAELRTSWAYDAAGQLIFETDADGSVTTYQYDALGRKIHEGN